MINLINKFLFFDLNMFLLSNILHYDTMNFMIFYNKFFKNLSMIKLNKITLLICKILTTFLIFFQLKAEVRLNNLIDNLKNPWSITEVKNNLFLITEKNGTIKLFNKENGLVSEVKHNLNLLEDGQGGLLDILHYDNYVYVSYSEKIERRKTSTSIARALYNSNELKFENLFQSNPPIDSGYHFGSRIVIKDDQLYFSSGERGRGSIAQDPSKHPGSIIRINLDGSIPRDNPKFKNKPTWLPEIYQIGIRNVQGMTLSPFDNEIYMTNHGAKGGDWFGKLFYGGNYGWDKLYWGGTKYSGLYGGPKWLPGFDKPIKYYVPSIAISACLIYKGKEFKEWNGDALVVSLKDMSLRKIKFTKNEFLKEEIIFKDKIGRLRDIKLLKSGKLLLLTDRGGLWMLSKT